VVGASAFLPHLLHTRYFVWSLSSSHAFCHVCQARRHRHDFLMYDKVLGRAGVVNDISKIPARTRLVVIEIEPGPELIGRPLIGIRSSLVPGSRGNAVG
jgi:hypothetical protein